MVTRLVVVGVGWLRRNGDVNNEDDVDDGFNEDYEEKVECGCLLL